MTEFMQKFGAFWAVWGPWISMMLIPTLITGLSLSPKTKKASTIVAKLWDGFKQVLSIFSIATFKDQPGTFQLPLKVGVLFKGKKGGDQSGGSKSGPSAGGCAALVLIIIFSGSQAGCLSWFKNEGKEVGKVVVDCSKEAVKTQAMQLVPAVLAMLTGGSVNWKDQLESFAKSFGRETIACALDIATKNLVASLPASGAGEDPGTAATREGLAKARTYVSEKGWTYKETP